MEIKFTKKMAANGIGVGLYLIIGIIAAVVLCSMAIPVVATFDVGVTKNATIDKKESVIHSERSKYLLFTDKGVFEITDTIVHGRWNSSDDYNSIREGVCYNIEHSGWRLPFFSMYPNALSVEKCDQ